MRMYEWVSCGVDVVELVRDVDAEEDEESGVAVRRQIWP